MNDVDLVTVTLMPQSKPGFNSVFGIVVPLLGTVETTMGIIRRYRNVLRHSEGQTTKPCQGTLFDRNTFIGPVTVTDTGLAHQTITEGMSEAQVAGVDDRTAGTVDIGRLEGGAKTSGNRCQAAW